MTSERRRIAVKRPAACAGVGDLAETLRDMVRDMRHTSFIQNISTEGDSIDRAVRPGLANHQASSDAEAADHTLTSTPNQPTLLKTWVRRPFAETWGRQSHEQPTGPHHPPAAQQPGWVGGKTSSNAAQQKQPSTTHTYPGTSLADCTHKATRGWQGERAGVPA